MIGNLGTDRDDLGNSGLTSIDVYQTLTRLPRGWDCIISTVLPSSKIFVFKDESREQNRLITGLELLTRIQGFPRKCIKDHDDIQKMVARNPLFGQLSGNAFPLCVFGAVFIGVFIHLPSVADSINEEDELLAEELLAGLGGGFRAVRRALSIMTHEDS